MTVSWVGRKLAGPWPSYMVGFRVIRDRGIYIKCGIKEDGSVGEVVHVGEHQRHCLLENPKNPNERYSCILTESQLAPARAKLDG